MRGVLAILSHSSRFQRYLRGWHAEYPGLISCFHSNLIPEPYTLTASFTSRGYVSINHSSISKADLDRFLKYLVNAYSKGEDTQFENLLNLKEIKQLLNDRLQFTENIQGLKELERDPEMKKLVEEEKDSHERQMKEIDEELIDLIITNLAGHNFDDVILDISAGIGGQESMLFVKDLLEMYVEHLTYLGYTYDIVELADSMSGGYRYCSLAISGKGCYAKLRHEAGVHRVQRVPATEHSGRMHTSVVSVSVMPQPSEIEINLRQEDLRIDTMRASGAGGQHVNTTNSAVRITHVPSGISVECQTERSQFKNRELAMRKLIAKIYEGKLERQLRNASSMKKQQMGMGLRHEKIRTYNYNQDRVTDHRLKDGTMHNLKGFLEGGAALDNLHAKLQEDHQLKVLLEAVKSVR
ncbi:hypothetical protein QAD02_001655 [Eretmocerus hayati]|uniref:Uncharacterized protein n=1 Tax=Eretmocerus hayati TaxID=131215 RepID=A0ACC2NHK0_9HYME|nr:hypothetical protein QAD02_001655 [Eretmocerus hayati]